MEGTRELAPEPVSSRASGWLSGNRPSRQGGAPLPPPAWGRGDGPGRRVAAGAAAAPAAAPPLSPRAWAIGSRIAAAHNSVLHDPRVADCIAAEIRQAGACPLSPADRGNGLPSWLDGLLPETQPQALVEMGPGTNPRLPSIV